MKYTKSQKRDWWNRLSEGQKQDRIAAIKKRKVTERQSKPLPKPKSWIARNGDVYTKTWITHDKYEVTRVKI